MVESIVYCISFHLKEQCVPLRGILLDFLYDLGETEGEVHYVLLPLHFLHFFFHTF